MSLTIELDGKLIGKDIHRFTDDVREAVLTFETETLLYTKENEGGECQIGGEIMVTVRNADLLDQLTVGRKYTLQIEEEDPFVQVRKNVKKKSGL